MGCQSRTRRRRREQRLASLRAIGQHWMRQGWDSAETLAQLESLPEMRLVDVERHCQATVADPYQKNYNAACMTLGALARLVHNRTHGSDSADIPGA